MERISQFCDKIKKKKKSYEPTKTLDCSGSANWKKAAYILQYPAYCLHDNNCECAHWTPIVEQFFHLKTVSHRASKPPIPAGTPRRLANPTPGTEHRIRDRLESAASILVLVDTFCCPCIWVCLKLINNNFVFNVN